ncbi:MAG: polyphosphate kinase 2 family protein [Proteobacteria bacterium]|nr:polyphosphate kinase 2 family protein [Pseudomonadota bacterium]
MSYLERFRVRPGARVQLAAIDPSFKDRHEGQDAAAAEIDECRKRLVDLQEMLYVERRRSLLICLQGLDTAGKDGTIKHLLSAMNPQGCTVVPFRQPTAQEEAHDFLWRVHRATPARGEVTIFNRSHYEDVLVVRVHDLVPKSSWSRRFDRINAFEQGLADQGTQILKFFLHISSEEQLARFKARLEDPTKQWKISESDYEERKYWDEYVTAYEEALSRCSTEHAPWFIIPANHKWFRNLAIGRILVEHLEGLKLTYPKPTVDLEHIRREYHAAKHPAGA